MLTGGLLLLAGCGGGTRVVTKTVVSTAPTTSPSTTPAPSGPSPAALAAGHAASATAIANNAVQVVSPLGTSVFVAAVAAAAGTLPSSSATTPATGTGHGGGTSGPKATAHRVISGQGSGQYAVAYTNGTFHHPSQLVLSVSASPAQTGSVTWNVVCFELSGGIGRNAGRETVPLPTTKTLPLPAPSSTCIGSANVQLSKSGTVTISISG